LTLLERCWGGSGRGDEGGDDGEAHLDDVVWDG
jgi:hypothetical protein